ncbi:MAG: DUF4115 domain-containing protein, partial [Desulfovibrio sp.]|nr:DUF4115 domain-containing protein [Desulfovibrio sp.]
PVSWARRGVSEPDALNGVATGGAAAQAPLQAPVHAAEPAPRPRERRGGGKGALFIVVLLLVAAGVYAGWRWGMPLLAGLEQQRLAQPSPPLTSAQPAPTADILKKTAAERAEAAKTAQPAATTAAPAPAAPVQQAQAAGAAQPATQPAASRSEASRPATPVREEATAASGPRAEEGRAPQEVAAAPAQAPDDAANPGQHKVIITATEECWIHSNADKTDTRQFSLRKGDTFALTFARSLELKLGNAGGVRIRYDGQNMPPAGQSGQVRTLTFPPHDGQ